MSISILEMGGLSIFSDVFSVDVTFLDEWLLNNLPEAPGLDQEKKLLLCRAILQVIDLNWLEHLEAMEYMRSSVGLRAYGQRDPLVEYKREGLKMFKEMEENILEEIKRL